jgi:Pup amidohydrolase
MAIPKILGTETEYGIIGHHDSNFDPISRTLLLINSYHSHIPLASLWDYTQESARFDPQVLSLDEICDLPDQPDPLCINKVLPNGAWYYFDHAHPEYSTPECTNVRDLVCYEKAEDRILEQSCNAAAQAFMDGRQILLYKNNSDHKDNSYGYHENYLLDRITPFRSVVEQFTPFIVSRQICGGAGKVGCENGTQPAFYQLSQRADFFETEVSLDTVAKRPLINTRNEPHANREKYRRLHMIVGDANMSEYALYLKLGTTVLAMIEDAFLPRTFTLRKPVAALQAVSRDLTCRQPLELDDGSTMSPIALQWEFWAAATRYCATRSVEPWSLDILRKWEYVLCHLEQDPRSLARELDWAIKWRLLTASMDRYGYDWDSAQVRMLDLQYYDMRREKGLYDVPERSGRVGRIVQTTRLTALSTNRHATRVLICVACASKSFASKILVSIGILWPLTSTMVTSDTSLLKIPFKAPTPKLPKPSSRQQVQMSLSRRYLHFNVAKGEIDDKPFTTHPITGERNNRSH